MEKHLPKRKRAPRGRPRSGTGTLEALASLVQEKRASYEGVAPEGRFNLASISRELARLRGCSFSTAQRKTQRDLNPKDPNSLLSKGIVERIGDDYSFVSSMDSALVGLASAVDQIRLEIRDLEGGKAQQDEARRILLDMRLPAALVIFERAVNDTAKNAEESVLDLATGITTLRIVPPTYTVFHSMHTIKETDRAHLRRRVQVREPSGEERARTIELFRDAFREAHNGADPGPREEREYASYMDEYAKSLRNATEVHGVGTGSLGDRVKSTYVDPFGHGIDPDVSKFVIRDYQACYPEMTGKRLLRHVDDSGKIGAALGSNKAAVYGRIVLEAEISAVHAYTEEKKTRAFFEMSSPEEREGLSLIMRSMNARSAKEFIEAGEAPRSSITLTGLRELRRLLPLREPECTRSDSPKG